MAITPKQTLPEFLAQRGFPSKEVDAVQEARGLWETDVSMNAGSGGILARMMTEERKESAPQILHDLSISGATPLQLSHLCSQYYGYDGRGEYSPDEAMLLFLDLQAKTGVGINMGRIGEHVRLTAMRVGRLKSPAVA